MPAQVPPVADEREGLVGYLSSAQRAPRRRLRSDRRPGPATPTPQRAERRRPGQARRDHRGARLDDLVLQREQSPDLSEAIDDYEADFRLGPDETLADALAGSTRSPPRPAAVRRRPSTSAAVPVPQGVPWYPDDVDAWSVRWVLLHLVEEIARHAGHADIVRESIDGATDVRADGRRRGLAGDRLDPARPPQDRGELLAPALTAAHTRMSGLIAGRPGPQARMSGLIAGSFGLRSGPAAQERVHHQRQPESSI